MNETPNIPPTAEAVAAPENPDTPAPEQPEVPMFQTPGNQPPDPDDDYSDPPILRSIRPSFWDFCNKL